MARRQLLGGEGTTLKEMRDAVLVLECVVCDRRDAFEREALVRQFGASASLSRLRRRLAMGCERMTGSYGDECRTRFPCLGDHPSR